MKYTPDERDAADPEIGRRYVIAAILLMAAVSVVGVGPLIRPGAFAGDQLWRTLPLLVVYVGYGIILRGFLYSRSVAEFFRGPRGAGSPEDADGGRHRRLRAEAAGLTRSGTIGSIGGIHRSRRGMRIDWKTPGVVRYCGAGHRERRWRCARRAMRQATAWAVRGGGDGNSITVACVAGVRCLSPDARCSPSALNEP